MWQLEDVTVRHGDTIAVDRVSLRIDPGEIVVILGPSGSGKSTLLRAIAGLQPLDHGRILIDGADAASVAPHRRGIGMMFQDHALFAHRDVAGNVEFGLRMAGVGAAARRDRVDAMLELVGLAGFGDRDVTTLSGGEAQRVALARSLAPDPALLLLDEPLGALDRELRDRLVDELPALLRQAGTTALHVTHDHDEAFAIADRLVVLADGRVRRVGPPWDVVDDPRSATVARFLGHRNVGLGEVVRLDAATVDPTGDLHGRVVRSRFRGDHHEVELDIDDGRRLIFRLPDPAEPGTRLRLSIDADRVARLTED